MVTGREKWLQGVLDAAAKLPAGPAAEAVKYLKDSQKSLERLASEVRKDREDNGPHLGAILAARCIEAALKGKVYPFPKDGPWDF